MQSISKDIVVNVKNDEYANAFGIRSNMDMQIDDLAGKISVLVSTNSEASACGLFSRNAVFLASGLGDAGGSGSTEDYGNMTLGTVSKDIGVSARGKNFATTVGMRSGNTLSMTAFSGRLLVNAASTGSGAEARGISSRGDMTLGSISKDITVSAQSKGYASAYGIDAGQHLSLSSLAGKLTVSSSGSGDNAGAYGLVSDKDLTLNTISKDITVSASGKGYAYAYGLSSDEKLVLGNASGKLTVNAVASTNDAGAHGLVSGKDMTLGAISKDITINAKGKRSSYAYGFASENALTLDELSGKLTVNSTASGDKAEAYGLVSGKDMTLNTISKDIVVSARGKADTVAYGLSSNGKLVLNDTFAGKLMVSCIASNTAGATAAGIRAGDGLVLGTISKGITVNVKGVTTAKAYGIMVESGVAATAEGKLGSVLVQSTGGDDAVAVGWNCAGAIIAGNTLSGKITVTSSGAAAGIVASAIRGGTFTPDNPYNYDPEVIARLGMDISVTGKTATAIRLTGATNFIIAGAAITAKIKGGDAADANAILGEDEVQNIVLADKAKLTGNVSLAGGDDVLDLRTGSSVTGNLAFGAGADTLNIWTGATLKGDISDLETMSMNLDTLDYSGMAMIQSAGEITGWESMAKNLVCAEGLKGTFTLVKASAATDWDSQFSQVDLYLNGTVAATIGLGGSESVGDYRYSLGVSADQKSIQLSIASVA